MKLQELFDTEPKSYKVVRGTPKHYQVVFTISGITIEMNIEFDKTYYLIDVEFNRVLPDSDTRDGHGVLGDVQEKTFELFSAVGYFLKRYHDKYYPGLRDFAEGYMFSAKEPSRKKLYRVLAKRLSDELEGVAPPDIMDNPPYEEYTLFFEDMY